MLLHAIFQESAARNPEALALDIPPAPHRPARIRRSYGALGRRADTLCGLLAAHVGPESRVAVLLPRHDPDLFASELAVLQAGAAYLALDPAHPDAHLRALLADADPAVLLTDAAGAVQALRLGVAPQRILDVSKATVSSEADLARSPTPSSLSPHSLAYIIYTSGTTGRSKGVLIEHGSITNLVQSDRKYFDLGPNDRVAQSSSHSYDSAIEEIWLAWASGATLVVLDDETVRLGPDLAPWLRAERITVLCPPPTLLRTMAVKDAQRELPDLRLLYVGGEALPRDVADSWAPGRWLVNGYGPTECTVTTLRARVKVGGPIAIGTPVEGTTAVVLGEAGQVLGDEQPGELAVGGVGLARGYLHLPELTAERFIQHGTLGRLYRTGDRVTRDELGTYHYLGRIDAQVKVRGHRIELEAVEAHLAAQAGVREAACRLQTLESGALLVGYIVPADPAAPPALPDLLARLRAALPPPMVPARLGVLHRLPRLSSGKLDRSALPELEFEEPSVEPLLGPVQERIGAAMASVLGLPGGVGRSADFFFDLGGDSVGAARVISLLRQDAATAALSVRDLYEARTVAELASRLAQRSPAPQRASVAPAATCRSLWGGTLIQGASLLLELWLSSLLLYGVFFLLFPYLLQRTGLLATLLLLPLLGIAGTAIYTPLSVHLLALIKRLLLGKYTPQRVPVWGSFYLRHWLLMRFARVVPWRWLEGTEFLSATLRTLGARIGKRVHIQRGVNLRSGGWDLLEIGDDASVGRDASLRLVSLECGELVVGAIQLGAGSVVETRAGMDPGTRLGMGAQLTALSWLPTGGELADHQWGRGVPARPTTPVRAPSQLTTRGDLSPWTHALATLAARFLHRVLVTYAPFVGIVALLPGVNTQRVLEGLALGARDGPFALGVALALAVGSLASTALLAISLRLMGPVREGALSRWGLGWIRLQRKCESVESAGRVLSGTLLWPPWLRLAGMRIGHRSEVSTILDVIPERVRIGSESFLADGIYLDGACVRRGVVDVATTQMGENTFLGNHVVVPSGTVLPDDVLIGVSTVADGAVVTPGTAWFGHPAFELPRPPPASMDRRLTHEPGPLRYLMRLGFEGLRFLLPTPPALLLLLWLALASSALADSSTATFVLLALPGLSLGLGLSLCLLVLGLKWALLGRVRPGTHALWSAWCSRWDLIYVAWGAWCRGLLAALEGTLFLAWYLRAMGMRIGRRVVLGAGFAQVVDPDMITIEDDATVNGNFQAHTFEDRLLKIDQVHIEKHATVAGGAVLFYGARIGAGAHVRAQSVVMKREHLVAGGVYAGCPTEQQ